MASTHWIHRTFLSPVFVNWASKSNNLPALMTYQEYCDLGADNPVTANIHQLPVSFWQTENPDDDYYIDYLTETGYTKEDFLALRERNYQEQLESFFKNGLYLQRHKLETTVTRIDNSSKGPQQELEKTLKKSGFGFRTGDNMLGALSRREALNVLLVLEIPEGCISDEEPQPVFERAEKTYETATAYFGVEKLDTVIPPEYIRQAYVVSGPEDIMSFDNPTFDSNYVVQSGLYDMDVLASFVEKQLSKEFDLDNISKVVLLLDEVFENTKSRFCITSLEKVLDTLEPHIEDELVADVFGVVLDKITEEKRAIRTPMEVLADDLAESDLESLPPEEVVARITTYLTTSKGILREKYAESPFDMIFVNELDSMKLALSCITPEVYTRIQNSSAYNDIYGEVETLRQVLEKKDEVSDIGGRILEDSLYAEEEQRVALNKQYECLENSIAMLNFAMTAEPNQAQKVLKYLRQNEMTTVTYEQSSEALSEITSSGQKPSEQGTPPVQ